MEGKWEAKEAKPEVEVKRVCEDAVVRVIVPAAGERGPDALAQDVNQLRAHPDGAAMLTLYLQHKLSVRVISKHCFL